jgi:hypothetical protein
MGGREKTGWNLYLLARYDEPIQLMEDASQVGLVKNEPENIKKNINNNFYDFCCIEFKTNINQKLL